MLHDHGISTWGSFVFGFDTDDSEVFDRTVEFGIEMQLTMALFAILTPYPGHQALPSGCSPKVASPTRSGGWAAITTPARPTSCPRR